MTHPTDTGRSDSTSRTIKASPQRIYQALLDPQAVAKWRPPHGMRMEITEYDAREGGTFRMALTYTDPTHPAQGKTSGNTDEVRGRFLSLVTNKRVVELVEFVSDDPSLAGEMTISTILAPAAGGTEVTILCENVPSGISPADHETGMASTLQNLAAFVETEGRH